MLEFGIDLTAKHKSTKGQKKH